MLSLTISVAVSARHHYMYYFNHAIKQHFLIHERLVTYNEWWSELSNSFLPEVLLPPQTSNESVATENTNITGVNASTAYAAHKIIKLEENILLGTPRLRQLRVVETNCSGSKSFVKYFHFICYPDYSYSDLQITGEHIGWDFVFVCEIFKK